MIAALHTEAAARADKHEGPFVVLRCSGDDHERRVLRSKAGACSRCVLAPVRCPSADATVDDGEWIEASAFLEFAILVMQRWLRGVCAAPPVIAPFVSIDNVADVRAQLLAARERFGAEAPERRALHELFHAAAALETFDTSRRRGLLDDVYLHGARAVSLARKHSPDAHAIDGLWKWAKAGWQ